jgi:hypothetical protein
MSGLPEPTGTNPDEFRSRLIKIAALAFAAIESRDRLGAHDDAQLAAEANLRSQGIPT